MKNVKKVIGLVLALSMALAFSGCGKMTAEKLVLKTVSALAKTPMTSQNMTLETDMSVGAGGISLETGMDMTVDMVMSQDPYRGYLDMAVTMDILGRSITQNLQSYVLWEDGTVTTYVHTDTGDLWQKTSMEVSAGELTGSYDWLKEKPVENLTLAEETRTVNGTEVYVLSCTITGEEMQKIMNAMGSYAFEKADLSEVDVTALKVPAVFYVDAGTFLPVQIEMEIQGMDEMVSGMMGQWLEGDLGSLGVDFEVGTIRVVLSEIGYEAVEVPQVPQEGLDNADTV